MVNRFTRNNRIDRPYYYGRNKLSVPRFKQPHHQNCNTFNSQPICRPDTDTGTDRDAHGCCGCGCCCCRRRRSIVEQQYYRSSNDIADRRINPDLAFTNSPKYDNITHKARHVDDYEPSIAQQRPRIRRNNARYQQTDVSASIQQQQRIRNNNKFRYSQQQRQRIRNNNTFGNSLHTDTFVEDSVNVTRQKRSWHSKKKFDKSMQTRDGFNEFVSIGTQKYQQYGGQHIQPLRIKDLQQEVQDHHNVNWNGPNQPPPIECDTEEEEFYLNRNCQIHDGSPTYEHGDWKWRGLDYDNPLEENQDNHEDEHEVTNHHYVTNLDDDQTEYLIETEDVHDLDHEMYGIYDDDQTETTVVEEDDLITQEIEYIAMDEEQRQRPTHRLQIVLGLFYACSDMLIAIACIIASRYVRYCLYGIRTMGCTGFAMMIKLKPH